MLNSWADIFHPPYPILYYYIDLSIVCKSLLYFFKFSSVQLSVVALVIYISSNLLSVLAYSTSTSTSQSSFHRYSPISSPLPDSAIFYIFFSLATPTEGKLNIIQRRSFFLLVFFLACSFFLLVFFLACSFSFSFSSSFSIPSS